jgi:hypothetical protein
VLVTLVVCILAVMPPAAPGRPPEILQIYRDPVKPGSERAYKEIEEAAARICAELQCPHPHLAIESLDAPKEVWWLNAYASEAEKERVAKAYTTNRALMAALEQITKRKEGLTETPQDVFATYRADLSRGPAWKVAGARFMVATLTREDRAIEGSVFEAADHTRFILRPVATLRDAQALAAAAGAPTRVFAVRPYWGMPAPEWVAADPDFWKSNPAAKAK